MVLVLVLVVVVLVVIVVVFLAAVVVEASHSVLRKGPVFISQWSICQGVTLEDMSEGCWKGIDRVCQRRWEGRVEFGYVVGVMSSSYV